MKIRRIIFKILKRIERLFLKYGLHKVYPTRVIWLKILLPLFRYLRPDSVNVRGNKMFLDSKDSLDLFINGVYEPFETELFEKEIKKGDVVLDIGANIGYYTLLFAKFAGEEGKVFSFEPDPDNFSLLKKNVEANGYKNVMLAQKAVSNKTERIRLYLREDNRGDNRIYDSHDGRHSIEIESIRLEDYFKDPDTKINYIKMDIQGAEVMAVQGMSSLLTNNKNIKIITEFWPSGLQKSGASPAEYLNLLIGYGFKLYHINEEKGKVEAVNLAELLKTYTPEKGNFTNLLCIKQ